MMKSNTSTNLCLSILFILLLPNCKKYVEIAAPRNELSGSIVFESYSSALSAISGLYSDLEQNFGFVGGADQSITWFCGLASDEYETKSNQASYIVFQNNTLSSATFPKLGLWEEPYQSIYYANRIIEGLEKTTKVTHVQKRQLIGEAKFIRALAYFYLVNMFGEVPLATTSDYQINNAISESGVAEIYAFIEAELAAAKENLPEDYLFANNERVRVNKYAASALLARVFLYQAKWEQAEQESSLVINNTSLYNLEPDINNVFKKNSTEAIWQLMPSLIAQGYNTREAGFLLVSPSTYISLREIVLDGFEPEDKRKSNWTEHVDNGGSYLVLKKYKEGGMTPATAEYAMILRLGEQYLIRAEARANLGNYQGCKEDLLALRQRAELEMPVGDDLQTLQVAIEQERKIELLGEQGHRWFDLKRWRSINDPNKTRADDVLSVLKGDSWQSTDLLFPIPQSEIVINPKLTQNPGYN